jgi:hypothetical protein
VTWTGGAPAIPPGTGAKLGELPAIRETITMAYQDSSNRPPVRSALRSEWWRQYLAAQSRHIAENRMRYFAVFGVLAILVAAVFLVPMFAAH